MEAALRRDTCIAGGPCAAAAAPPTPAAPARPPAIDDSDPFGDASFAAVRESVIASLAPRALPVDAAAWVRRVLDYNVRGGKMSRGRTVIAIVSALRGGTPSPSERRDAAVAGWALEWMQALFLIADDVMDDGLTRRHRACWHRVPGVGAGTAINDSLLMQSQLYQLLRLQFGTRPFYTRLVELFMEVTWRTELGQMLDMATSPGSRDGSADASTAAAGTCEAPLTAVAARRTAAAPLGDTSDADTTAGSRSGGGCSDDSDELSVSDASAVSASAAARVLVGIAPLAARGSASAAPLSPAASSVGAELASAHGSAESASSGDWGSLFTWERYRCIATHKTGYYSFWLPVAVALILVGQASDSAVADAEAIAAELGVLFQAQDDYLDCYADPAVLGKIGTDIADNKCSWLIVQALELATAEQRRTLQACYGRRDDAAIAAVKRVYAALDLPTHFTAYETSAYHRLRALILERCDGVPDAAAAREGGSVPAPSADAASRLPAAIFLQQLDKMYRRVR